MSFQCVTVSPVLLGYRAPKTTSVWVCVCGGGFEKKGCGLGFDSLGLKFDVESPSINPAGFPANTSLPLGV